MKREVFVQTNTKVMVITGASSGFGRIAAVMAAQQGYRVVVAARRAERLHDLVAEIERNGGAALAVPCDVTKDADQQNLVDTTLAHFGRLDVLVNNAGVPLDSGFVDSSVEELRRQWDTNVLSLVTLTKRATAALIASQGVIINIGSTAGHMSIPGMGTYFSTKVSVRSLSDTLRRELRAHGVRVSLVEPGPYATEFGERAGAKEFAAGLPPEQVARVIVQLAEHPRAVAVVPWYFGPLVNIGGTIEAVVPWLVDLIFFAIGKRNLRKQAESNGLATAR